MLYFSSLLMFMVSYHETTWPALLSPPPPTAGIALLYLHLHSVYGDPSYLQRALDYVNHSLRSLTQRWVTFLCGDAGPLAIAAVVYHRLQKPHEAEECVNRSDPALPPSLCMCWVGDITLQIRITCLNNHIKNELYYLCLLFKDVLKM